jgi:hypothetical protein
LDLADLAHRAADCVLQERDLTTVGCVVGAHGRIVTFAWYFGDTKRVRQISVMEDAHSSRVWLGMVEQIERWLEELVPA